MLKTSVVEERGTPAAVPNNWLKWDLAEPRLCVLHNGQSGIPFIAVGQRYYFGSNTKLVGKRIVQIDITADENNLIEGFPMPEIALVSFQILKLGTLTIVDDNYVELVKDYPLADLFARGSKPAPNNLRIFNLLLSNLEKSYVVFSTGGFAPASGRFAAILFNFYTVRW